DDAQRATRDRRVSGWKVEAAARRPRDQLSELAGPHLVQLSGDQLIFGIGGRRRRERNEAREGNPESHRGATHLNLPFYVGNRQPSGAERRGRARFHVLPRLAPTEKKGIR